ncbi:zn 2cys6 transcription factor [Colletotrichum kahawae]|uniref:Zn 2cys6 transcription factor n=1 Tax=Colletotrichum kahawae TaxID=34407 RepID=A0AAD9Y8U6_COLKA|nr:zn 2cys6 transcription factor [Colletotrichum kahawae]
MPPKSGSKRAQPPRKRVLKAYISELHDRLAAYERRESNEDPVSRNLEDLMSPDMYDNLDTTRRSSGLAPASPSSSRGATAAQEPGDVAEAPLTNPLAFHTIDWVPGPHGAPAVTGTPLQIDNLFFDGNVYDLKWDGSRSSSARDDFCPSNLPTQDFAIYLINSVKFRCGRLFYLFDEESFMKQFAIFHEHGANHPGLSRLCCRTSAYRHSIANVAGQLNELFDIDSSENTSGVSQSFLTFDLDATFTAAIAISMGAAIDPSLIPDHAQLTQRAHALFDEMSSHGSKIAAMIASELKQLDGYLSHLQTDGAEILPIQDFRSDVMAQIISGGTLAGAPELGMGFTDDIDFGLHFELSTEQLMQLANSLDVDSLSRPLSADQHGT